MSFTINNHDIIKKLGLDVEIELESTFTNDFYLEPMLMSVEGEYLKVAYLTYESEAPEKPCQEYFVVVVPSSQEEFNQKKKDFEGLGHTLMPIEKYDHGNVSYSVSGTGGYPDRQWDMTGIAGFIAIPSEFSDKKTPEDLVKAANSELEIYSDWCNGNCFSPIVAKYHIHDVVSLASRGMTVPEEDFESYGPHIGEDNSISGVFYAICGQAKPDSWVNDGFTVPECSVPDQESGFEKSPSI